MLFLPSVRLIKKKVGGRGRRAPPLFWNSSLITLKTSQGRAQLFFYNIMPEDIHQLKTQKGRREIKQFNCVPSGAECKCCEDDGHYANGGSPRCVI